MLLRHFYFAFVITCFCCVSARAESLPSQLEAQADSLSNLIYLGAEQIEGRRYYLFPISAETTYSVVLFSFEPGNRYKHWMAIFETAEQLRENEPTKNKFTLVAVQVVGKKSWRAIEFSRPDFSYDVRKGDVTITLKTTENTDDDASNFPSKRSRAIYTLKRSFYGHVLNESKNNP